MSSPYRTSSHRKAPAAAGYFLTKMFPAAGRRKHSGQEAFSTRKKPRPVSSRTKRAGTIRDRKSSRKTPRATTAVTAMATTVPSRMPLSRISTQRKAKATNGIMRIIRQSQNIHPPKTKRTRGCGCSPSLCVPSCVPVSSALPVMEPMH